MGVYYTAFMMAAFVSILYPRLKQRRMRTAEEKRTRWIVFSFLPIAVVFLLRWKVGIDSNWGIGSYPVYYRALANGTHIFTAEPLFEILANLCAKCGVSYFGWLFLLGLFYLYAMGKFIRDNSCDYPMSILLFLFTDLFFFAVSALRQALAVSFILLLYCEHTNRISRKEIIYMILAILSHSSGIIGVICYLLGKIKLLRNSVLYTTVAIMVCSPLTTVIMKAIIRYTSYGMRYDGTNMATDQFAITYALASGCILLCTILEYDYIYNERTSRFVNLQIAFFFFMMNSGALIQTFRIIYYFMPAVVILIPEIFKKSHNKLSKGVLGTVALLAMILLFYNTYYRLNGKAAYENYQTILSSIDMIFAI